MSNVLAVKNLLGLVEHAAFIIVGFFLMVVGLGLGVTMIILPVGIVVGPLGFVMFVGGLLVHLDKLADRWARTGDGRFGRREIEGGT